MGCCCSQPEPLIQEIKVSAADGPTAVGVKRAAPSNNGTKFPGRQSPRTIRTPLPLTPDKFQLADSIAPENHVKERSPRHSSPRDMLRQHTWDMTWDMVWNDVSERNEPESTESPSLSSEAPSDAAATAEVPSAAAPSALAAAVPPAAAPSAAAPSAAALSAAAAARTAVLPSAVTSAAAAPSAAPPPAEPPRTALQGLVQAWRTALCRCDGADADGDESGGGDGGSDDGGVGGHGAYGDDLVVESLLDAFRLSGKVLAGAIGPVYVASVQNDLGNIGAVRKQASRLHSPRLMRHLLAAELTAGVHTRKDINKLYTLKEPSAALAIVWLRRSLALQVTHAARRTPLAARRSPLAARRTPHAARARADTHGKRHVALP
jgi:hypothetical protein